MEVDFSFLNLLKLNGVWYSKYRTIFYNLLHTILYSFLSVFLSPFSTLLSSFHITFSILCLYCLHWYVHYFFFTRHNSSFWMPTLYFPFSDCSSFRYISCWTMSSAFQTFLPFGSYFTFTQRSWQDFFVTQIYSWEPYLREHPYISLL